MIFFGGQLVSSEYPKVAILYEPVCQLVPTDMALFKSMNLWSFIPAEWPVGHSFFFMFLNLRSS